MQTRIERKEDTLFVFLSGEIDHHHAAFSRIQIDDAIACAMPKHMVIDFAEVTFMDSSGIGLVMGRYKLLAPQNGTLKLSGLSGHIYKVMRLAGLEQLVSLSKTPTPKPKEEAVAAKQEEAFYETHQ